MYPPSSYYFGLWLDSSGKPSSFNFFRDEYPDEPYKDQTFAGTTSYQQLTVRDKQGFRVVPWLLKSEKQPKNIKLEIKWGRANQAFSRESRPTSFGKEITNIGYSIIPGDYQWKEKAVKATPGAYQKPDKTGFDDDWFAKSANNVEIFMPINDLGSDLILGSGNFGHISGMWSNHRTTNNPRSSDKQHTFAIAPWNSYIHYNLGNDFLAGGWQDDLIKPASGLANFESNTTNNNKLIVGGSGRDEIIASFGNDYLVGDRFFGGEGGFVSRSYNPDVERDSFTTTNYNPWPVQSFPQLKSQEVNSFWMGVDGLKTQYPDQLLMLDRTLNYSFIDGYGSKGGVDNTGRVYYEKPVITRVSTYPSGLVPPLPQDGWGVDGGTNAGLGMNYLAEVGNYNEFYNLWQPKGDSIYGGRGNDTIFGDDNNFQWSRLIEYKLHMKQQNSDDANKLSAFKMQPANISYGKTKGNFDDPSYDVNGFKLGNDILDGGPGQDILFGGFGKDVIIGGQGADIIFAPTTILIPGYGAVQGAPTLYGDQTGRQKRESNPDEKLDSFTRSDASDIFVIGAAVYDEEMLKARFPSKGLAPGQDQLKKLENTWKTIDKVQKASKGIADIASIIPKVGPVIKGAQSIISTFIDLFRPTAVDKKDKKPNPADYLTEIRDFDFGDSLIVVANRGETVTFQDNQTKASIEQTAGRDNKIDYIDEGNNVTVPNGSIIYLQPQEASVPYARVHLYSYSPSRETDQIINYVKNLNIKNRDGMQLSDALIGIKEQIGKKNSPYPNHMIQTVHRTDTASIYTFTHVFQSTEAHKRLEALGFDMASFAGSDAEMKKQFDLLGQELAGYAVTA